MNGIAFCELLVNPKEKDEKSEIICVFIVQGPDRNLNCKISSKSSWRTILQSVKNATQKTYVKTIREAKSLANAVRAKKFVFENDSQIYVIKKIIPINKNFCREWLKINKPIGKDFLPQRHCLPKMSRTKRISLMGGGGSLGSFSEIVCRYPGCNNHIIFHDGYCWEHYQDERFRKK